MAAARTLVVYYSWTGNTRKVAQALTDALNCDIEEIVEPRRRAGIFGYVRSIFEVRRKRPSVVAPGQRDVSTYDLAVIGTPVWAWSVSSPVRAYLTNNAGRFPAVAFFCTLGGRGDDTAFVQMQSLSGKTPRAVMAITDRDVASGNFRDRLAAFVKALRSE